MKIKSRIKDSSGQNYVGVELNLNVHFLAANALASKNVLILRHKYRICGLAAAEILFSLYLVCAHYEVFHFPPDLRQRAHTQKNFVNLSLFWSGKQIVGILLEIIEFL